MKLIGKKPELCIGCRACETACSQTWFKEDNAAKSCIRIKDEDSDSKIVCCTQCGECIAVCPVEALTRDKNGIVRINKKTCVGCFMCVGYCPELYSKEHGKSVHAMGMHEDHIEPFKCVTCGQCVKACPTEAIYIKEEA